MFKEVGQLDNIGSAAPGQEYLAVKAPKGELAAMVSVYLSVPLLGHVTTSFVRVNLFGDVGGTRQHLASAICPAGTSGEVIAVSGHVADSYHVTLQATNPRQSGIKLGLVAMGCCASPKVRVRPDLLSLAFAPPEVGLGGLEWYPVVPWGGEFGAPNAYTAVGSGSILMPAGARLTHWLAQGTGLGGTVEFDGLASGPILTLLAAAPAREGFPAAQYVSQIVYTNLLFGLFEIVV
jgi:hypothetical protein